MCRRASPSTKQLEQYLDQQDESQQREIARAAVRGQVRCRLALSSAICLTADAALASAESARSLSSLRATDAPGEPATNKVHNQVAVAAKLRQAAAGARHTSARS